jgi:predicted AlkP superfamily pyrophosphatase or phosphodiesterase
MREVVDFGRRASLLGALCLVALAGCAATPSPASAHATEPATERATERDVEVVLLVSVDGLRSDALLAVPGSLPAFDRLRQGAHTLNARTDPDVTVTLPNHTGILTGRFRDGADGHGWRANGEVEPHEDLHANAGAYLASAFDVAHDHGARTVLLAGKTKFALYAQSYDAQRGAPDRLPPDHGRAKIDRTAIEPDPARLTDLVLDELARARGPLLLVAHYAAPDLVAHKSGWDVGAGSPYLRAVADVDAALGRVLDAVERDPGLAPRTALIVTTDHGGGAPWKSHTQAHMWINAVIPFLVWTRDATPADLYALNPSARRDPGLTLPARDARPQPVRNLDAGNLALDLLGFPPIPGSRANAAQDLRALNEDAR